MALFLEALQGKKTDRFPVWLMRQAGRYMPSYQAYKKRYSLYELFHHPELAAQITLLPVKELQVDAAILFSDILMILKSLGLTIHYPAQGGPFSSPQLDPEVVEKLAKHPVEESLSCVYEAAKNSQEKLAVPLIGFAGGPFTVASYAIEASKRHPELIETKKLMRSFPNSFKKLLDLIGEQTIDYLKLQVKAGASAVQVFDSWAGILPLDEFRLYSLSYLKKIVKALHPIPVIYFSRGSCVFAEEILTAHPAGLSLDWTIPIDQMRRRLGGEAVLQGNFDPTLLFAPVDVIEKTVIKTLSHLPCQGTIVNLGHGILPHTPYEHVRRFVTISQEVALKREWLQDSPLIETQTLSPDRKLN